MLMFMLICALLLVIVVLLLVCAVLLWAGLQDEEAQLAAEVRELDQQSQHRREES